MVEKKVARVVQIHKVVKEIYHIYIYIERERERERLVQILTQTIVQTMLTALDRSFSHQTVLIK